jgi:hypothetical protein
VILEVPRATPVTMPVVFTVALVPSLLLHDSTPPVVLASVVVAPTHNPRLPVRLFGVGLMVPTTDFVQVLGAV